MESNLIDATNQIIKHIKENNSLQGDIIDKIEITENEMKIYMRLLDTKKSEYVERVYTYVVAENFEISEYNVNWSE